MPKKIDLGVERDHIESLTKANGITAITELIWNALDADSTLVQIEFKINGLDTIDYIKVSDNGLGLKYEKAEDVFSRLGGSEKKESNVSPGGRSYHGKEGKGRYKALALGDLVTFKSIFKNGAKYKTFDVKIDRNNLTYSEISDLKNVAQHITSSGFEVLIQNIKQENALQALGQNSRVEIEQKLASYWLNYPDFIIYFNKDKLEFDSLIKFTDEIEVSRDVDDEIFPFYLKIIEWKFDIKKKTYLCNRKGVPYIEHNLGVRSSIPISMFIQSTYIEKLHRENLLELDNLDETLNYVYNEAKKFARDYIRKRLHFYSSEYITELKSKGLYPYKDQPENLVEESKRQVFDIVALQVHEYLPNFDEQDDKSKKLTLSLIKESLEKDSSSLQRILSEVIDLPEDKRNELVEILEETTLSNVIDTMTEIKNRLSLLIGLEQIIYDDQLNKNIKERKHLHKIVIKETWIFGDQYTYGVDDLTLKNVLKAYLKDSLGRDDFQEIIDGEDNSDLQTIPDVCLWQQFSQGNAGKENLVIELKKPTVDAGFNEKTQIESYASKVANDPRFPKEKTRWKFILITRDVKSEIMPLMKQTNRKYGHITEGENFDVYILTWGHILNEAKIKHEFIRDKLNMNLQENQKGLDYLSKKYKEYLPDDFK